MGRNAPSGTIAGMRQAAALSLLALIGSCSTPTALADLDENCPPPEYGRPGWVRASAKVGAWLGAVPGALLTVICLPVTWPLTLIAEEPLGHAKNEVIFFPLSFCASAGHFVLGAPADSVHWVFYRAWTDQPSPVGYSFVPASPPKVPEGELAVPSSRPSSGATSGATTR